jgi:transcriptional regulator with XRE-family HTH domain
MWHQHAVLFAATLVRNGTNKGTSVVTDQPTLKDTIADAVARNLRDARTERGWTLDQLATRSGVSKGMLVSIEQARTNPSIGTLSKIGEALGVSLSDLVNTASGPIVRLVPAEDAAQLWETEAGSLARLLVGGHRPDFIEFWEWRLAPGDTYDGRIHASDIRELLHVLEGDLSLTVGDVETVVATAGSASYAGDQPHRYHNAGSIEVRFVLVMVDPSGARSTE